MTIKQRKSISPSLWACLAALAVAVGAVCIHTVGGGARTTTAKSARNTDPVVPASPRPSTPIPLASHSVRAKAAAILKADDTYYSAELAQGEKADGTASWTAWCARTQADVGPSIDAQNQAATLLAAVDAQSEVRPWSDFSSQAGVDLLTVCQDGGTTAASANRARINQDAAVVLSDLSTADLVAEDIATDHIGRS